MPYIIKGVVGGLQPMESVDDVAAVEAFFAGKDCCKFTMTLAQTLDKLRSRQKWFDEQGAEILAYLEQTEPKL